MIPNPCRLEACPFIPLHPDHSPRQTPRRILLTTSSLHGEEWALSKTKGRDRTHVLLVSLIKQATQGRRVSVVPIREIYAHVVEECGKRWVTERQVYRVVRDLVQRGALAHVREGDEMSDWGYRWIA